MYWVFTRVRLQEVFLDCTTDSHHHDHDAKDRSEQIDRAAKLAPLPLAAIALLGTRTPSQDNLICSGRHRSLSVNRVGYVIEQLFLDFGDQIAQDRAVRLAPVRRLVVDLTDHQPLGSTTAASSVFAARTRVAGQGERHPEVQVLVPSAAQ